MRRRVITLGILLVGVALMFSRQSSLAGDAGNRLALRSFSAEAHRLSLPEAPFSGAFGPAAGRAKDEHRRVGGSPLPFDDEPELSVDVDASSEEALSGSNITFTVTVTNEGTAAASAFTVTDELPAETTFISCEATSGGVCGGSGNSRSVSFETLASEASATITLVTMVNCPVANGAEIVNTAEVHPLTPDPEADEVENDTVLVTIRNPTPSVTGAAANPSTLWPPNHQMADVRVDYNVADNCGPLRLDLRVTSNEPVNGTGDGDTAPDWQLINAHLVRLRQERAGGGNGRVYTITIMATDSAGQSSSKTVTVTVPKNQKK